MKIQGHIQQESCKKILNLGYSALPHPPYSLDLGISDYYLFHSQHNALNNKKFSQEQVKIFVENFLCSKPVEFYLRQIKKLPEK